VNFGLDVQQAAQNRQGSTKKLGDGLLVLITWLVEKTH